MSRRKLPPPHVHQLFHFIYAECAIENVYLNDLCKKAGISYQTFKEAAQGRRGMSLGIMEALLNALGYTMKPTPLPTTQAPVKKQKRTDRK